MTKILRQEHLLYPAAAIAVLIIYQCSFGLETLLPTNVSWLMSRRGDWGGHYLGWFFYRNDPWRFPLGKMSSYFYPLGTNIAFTDSIPLMAIFFKLFSPLLPADFQYFGIWLLLSDFLVAWYSIRILRLLKVRDFYIFVAVVFIVANPVLIFRGMHPALFAHWLILGSLYCYLRDPKGEAVRPVLREQFILFLLAALINPYMCCMVLAFALILPWKLFFYDKVLRLKQSWVFTGLILFTQVAVWVVLGMISLGKQIDFDGEGYGLYSLNLNALYNSFSWSSIFPTPKLVSWHQYEGYMYLGAGIFLLLIVLTGNALFRWARPTGSAIPDGRPSGVYRSDKTLLLALAILFTLFALSNIISINDKVLFRIPLSKGLLKLANIYRAGARFFWLPFYLIILYAIVAVSRMRIPGIAITILLTGALVLQLYDTHRLLITQRLAHGAYIPSMDNHWSQLIAATDGVVFYPPFEATYVKEMDYQDFSFLAAKFRKPVTIGYIARQDHVGMRAFTDSLIAAMQDARPSKVLYVTNPEHIQLFTNVLLEKKLRLSMLDGYCYMYAPDLVNDKGVDALSDSLDLANAVRLDSLRKTIQASEYTAISENQAAGLLEAGKLKFNFEWMTKGNRYLACSGWGIIENSKTNKGDSIFSLLLSDKKIYIGQNKMEKRPDISGAFHGDLDDAGFKGVISTTFVDIGVYRIGLGIQNGDGKIVYAATDSVLLVDNTHHVLRGH